MPNENDEAIVGITVRRRLQREREAVSKKERKRAQKNRNTKRSRSPKENSLEEHSAKTPPKSPGPEPLLENGDADNSGLDVTIMNCHLPTRSPVPSREKTPEAVPPKSINVDVEDHILRSFFTSPSTARICRAAAEKPIQAPGTLWVALEEDEDVLVLTQRLPENTVTVDLNCTVRIPDTVSSRAPPPGAPLTQPISPNQNQIPTVVFKRDSSCASQATTSSATIQQCTLETLPPTFRERKSDVITTSVSRSENGSIHGNSLGNSKLPFAQQVPGDAAKVDEDDDVLFLGEKTIYLPGRVTAPVSPARALTPRTPPLVPRAPLLDANSLHTSEDSSTRPVDRALDGLFPLSFTKAKFLEDAHRVVREENCLKRGQFWEAIESAEYIGEGSFGLVWRCKTVEGDEVAVKSCPISFQYPECIDDAYSILREISIMRFLNEAQVPYVLPLHAAFLCESNEAMPPLVLGATRERKDAHECSERIKKCDQQLKKAQLALERQQRRTKKSSLQTVHDDPEVIRLTAKLSLEQNKLREHEKKIEDTLKVIKRFPKFFAIDEENALTCNATIFLVTDLCDGDLESIERNEAVSKRVAFCISTALRALHSLGLVHLDLKPANILFAYDRNGSGQSAIKFVLSDFGNCQIVGRSYCDTVHPAIGTYEYMDTEALQNRSCCRATDCFSLGCTLFELMTGKRYVQSCKKRACCDRHSPRRCYVPILAAKLPDISHWGSSTARGPGCPSPSNGNAVLAALVAELLHSSRNERMTAHGCYLRLVDAFGVTAVTPGRGN